VDFTFSNGSKNQDARLFTDPVRVEQQFLQHREQVGQQLIPKHICQDIKGGCRTLTYRANQKGG